MKKIVMLLCLGTALLVKGQDKKEETKIPVMVLGTFHFAYPNLDAIKVEKKEQVDVLSKERQAEIEEIIQRLKKFKPTKIAIEVKTWMQPQIDSEYAAYLKDSFSLPKGEQYQVGFRLAKMLGHKKIYCTDAWGNIDYFFSDAGNNNYEVRPERKSQMDAFDAFEDSLMKAGAFNIQQSQKNGQGKYMTLQQVLAGINDPGKLKRDHSNYFGARFQFEASGYDYTGTDWLALTWYSRNLRIFRNIQRISNDPGDRILAIYGSGHAYLLNRFLNESLQYKVVSPLLYISSKQK